MEELDEEQIEEEEEEEEEEAVELQATAEQLSEEEEDRRTDDYNGNRSWKMRLMRAPPDSSAVSIWSPEPSMRFSKSTENCCTILQDTQGLKFLYSSTSFSMESSWLCSLALRPGSVSRMYGVPMRSAKCRYPGWDMKNFRSAAMAALMSFLPSMSFWLRFTTPMYPGPRSGTTGHHAQLFKALCLFEFTMGGVHAQVNGDGGDSFIRSGDSVRLRLDLPSDLIEKKKKKKRKKKKKKKKTKSHLLPDEVLQHGALPRTLAAHHGDLRQVQVGVLADGGEGILHAVHQGDQVLHASVAHLGGGVGRAEEEEKKKKRKKKKRRRRPKATYFPTKFSNTELFPALWPPTTAI
ncbi:hypothetical protein CRUP_003742 [Coryphaenoides rupestris]|nr:hypothetical protein CRUP_003742 [Coryphaenoides rupestris]